jgi:hypothetical protein
MRFEAAVGDTLSREAALGRLARLANLLDARWGIPGTRFRIGLDGLIGLVPGVGDAAGLILSLYLVGEAWRLGVPASLLARMLVNVGLDSAVGAVPLVGDIFDIAFKANRRNVGLLRRHMERQGHPAPERGGGARRR